MQQFLVTISSADLHRANAEHMSQQKLAYFIQHELRNPGGRYLLEEWAEKVLENVLVRPFNSSAKT